MMRVTTCTTAANAVTSPSEPATTVTTRATVVASDRSTATQAFDVHASTVCSVVLRIELRPSSDMSVVCPLDQQLTPDDTLAWRGASASQAAQPGARPVGG